MTNEHRLSAGEAPPESKLIQLANETRAIGQSRDINARIGLLESSLRDLQTELDAINQSVDQGLERLDDSDLDLTARVSETYRRLGEIDKAYKALSAVSETIDKQVRTLATEIEDVAAQSATDLENHNVQMTEQHEQLVERVNALVAHSYETSAQLAQSIKDNTDALLKLEKELVAEIDSLASATSERSDHIEKELESSKARILQLQAVDDALEKRAASLETTAARLTQARRELEVSLELLERRTDELTDNVEQLYEYSEKHSTLIGALQDKSVEMAMSLKALARTENRHFRILSSFLLLAIVAIAALYFYHQSEMRHDAMVTAERSQVVDQQLTGLQQASNKSAITLEQMQHGLVALSDRVDNQVRALTGKLQAMDDQAQSLDGRISATSPFSEIGSDNIIHGPQWLAQQPAGDYAILVASVSDRKALYDVAQRYNRYLKDKLSYYTVNSGNSDSFVLVSGGYAGQSDAAAVMRRLPRYVSFQRPVITQMAEIQKQL